MDTKELASAKRELELRIEQELIEFEEKSGMAVKGFKIKRVDSAAACPVIDCVIIKIEIPDMD